MADDISKRKDVCSETKRFSHADGVLSSCVGYDCGEAKWLILRSPDGKRFRDGAKCRLVREADRKLAGEPVIRHWGVMWDHHWWRVDFTVADEPGTYRMEIPLAAGGTVAGDPIEIAAHRLFDETWRATSIDLLPKRHHRDGGWFDCGNGGSCDRNAHPFMVTGLLDLLERHGGMAPEDRKVLVNEIERGLTCLIKAQTPTGWWKSDTRSRPECVLAFALGSRLLADERPELAAECRARALRLIPCALVPGIDWREAKRRRDRIDAGKELAARGYPGTYYLLTVAAARVELLRAGDEGQLPDIVDLLRRVAGRQIPADKPEGKYWGHFLAEDGGQTSVMVGMTEHGAWRPYWLVPFIDMCRLRPKHPDAARWRKVVEDFTRGNLLPACKANPFLLVPNGYYRQAEQPGLRWFANRWHGYNMAYAYTAALALEIDGFLKEPELRRIAIGNLQWITGMNVGLPRTREDRDKKLVFGQSMMFGVGWRYVGGWLGDRGMISNGFKCGQEFKTPDLDCGDWPDYQLWESFLEGKDRAFLSNKTPEGHPAVKGAEEWIVHVGAWLSAISRLRQSQQTADAGGGPASRTTTGTLVGQT